MASQKVTCRIGRFCSVNSKTKLKICRVQSVGRLTFRTIRITQFFLEETADLFRRYVFFLLSPDFCFVPQFPIAWPVVSIGPKKERFPKKKLKVMWPKSSVLAALIVRNDVRIKALTSFPVLWRWYNQLCFVTEALEDSLCEIITRVRSTIDFYLSVAAVKALTSSKSLDARGFLKEPLDFTCSDPNGWPKFLARNGETE